MWGFSERSISYFTLEGLPLCQWRISCSGHAKRQSVTPTIRRHGSITSRFYFHRDPSKHSKLQRQRFWNPSTHLRERKWCWKDGYPFSFDIDWILQHPNIVAAIYMKIWPSKEETRQILITYLGKPLEYLRTTTGTFFLRNYYPEPVRCAKCQRFVHHFTDCRPEPRYGQKRRVQTTNF